MGVTAATEPGAEPGQAEQGPLATGQDGWACDLGPVPSPLWASAPPRRLRDQWLSTSTL